MTSHSVIFNMLPQNLREIALEPKKRLSCYSIGFCIVVVVYLVMCVARRAISGIHDESSSFPVLIT